MKTTIIFGFCAAKLTILIANVTTNSSNQSVTSTSVSIHPTTLLSTSDPPGPHATSQPNHKCSTVLPSTTPAYNKLFSQNHLLLFAGGLILACTILLISTLLLAWKVCQLSRRLKMLSGHSDLMSPAKIWMGKNKSNADAKETTVLMSDLNQTRDEDGEGGDEPGTERKKKEEKDMCKNGVEQKEKSAKNEEVKETPAAATEDSSSPKEEGEKSQVDNSKSSPTSEEKKEAKDEEKKEVKDEEKKEAKSEE